MRNGLFGYWGFEWFYGEGGNVGFWGNLAEEGLVGGKTRGGYLMRSELVLDG